MKLKKIIANTCLTTVLLTGAVGISVSPVFAQSAGAVNEDVKTGIDDTIATVKALSPLALACLSVALVPFGSMLTLRFLNMVLSRV